MTDEALSPAFHLLAKIPSVQLFILIHCDCEGLIQLL